MAAIRVTVTLDEDLHRKAKALNGRNFSKLVGGLLQDHLENERKRKLRDDLIAGCIANAELDLEICREWAYVDSEMALSIEP